MRKDAENKDDNLEGLPYKRYFIHILEEDGDFSPILARSKYEAISLAIKHGRLSYEQMDELTDIVGENPGSILSFLYNGTSVLEYNEKLHSDLMY